MCIKHFGLKAGQDPEILRVALEAAVRRGDLVERPLAVVPVRRVADVVGQPGQFDQIGVAAQPDRHPPPDLGHLQRMRQPGARSVAFAGSDHLRLVRQPSQRGAVQHPGPVAGEVGAVLAFGPGQTRRLRPFDHPPLTVEVVVGVWLILRHV